MLEAIDFSPDFALLGALRADISVTEKADVLARLAQLAEGNRRGLEKHTREFHEMYEEAYRRLPSEGLAVLAERICEGEAGARELLYPWMDTLRQTMSASSDEGRQYIQELLKISEAWLTLYRETRDKLLQLAAERRAAAQQIRRARPVAGEIDYGGLTREIIARYPNILKALAE